MLKLCSRFTLRLFISVCMTASLSRLSWLLPLRCVVRRLTCIIALFNSQRYFDLLVTFYSIFLDVQFGQLFERTIWTTLYIVHAVRQYCTYARMLLGGAIKRKHSVCRLDRTLVECPFRKGNCIVESYTLHIHGTYHSKCRCIHYITSI